MGKDRVRKRNFSLAISLVLVAAMFSFYLSPQTTQQSLTGEVAKESYLQWPNDKDERRVDNEIKPILVEPKRPKTKTKFAVIGDFGSDAVGQGLNEQRVANLVKSWEPEFIVTTGDNNYPDGKQGTIDQNIGKYYQGYIKPYTGSYGTGSPDKNRFFPSLGNHDGGSGGTFQITPYLNYFELPNVDLDPGPGVIMGNERVYDFKWNNIRFFVLSTDPRSPTITPFSNVQKNWLRDGLQNSQEDFNFVIMHHSPYSSDEVHPNYPHLRPPTLNYPAWGADAVFAGHAHLYERFDINGFPYFVNGLGGKSFYQFGTILPGSEVRYNAKHGAQLVEVDGTTATIKFITWDGVVEDTLVLQAS